MSEWTEKEVKNLVETDVSNSEPYLRVITTTRCNHSCVYCFNEGISDSTKTDISVNDVHLASQGAEEVGVWKIHFTGGEPLLHPRIVDIIKVSYKSAPSADICLTTNGVFLQNLAKSLVDSGLRRINVSLPSLTPENYRRICGENNLEKVLNGIQKAVEVGLQPIKLNIPIIRSTANEIEKYIFLFAELECIILRFFVVLPYNESARKLMVPEREIRNRVTKTIKSLSDRKIDLAGRILIRTLQPTSYKRCQECDYKYTCGERALAVRLTPDGLLRPCLLNPSFAEEFIRSKNPIKTLRRALDLVRLESRI